MLIDVEKQNESADMEPEANGSPFRGWEMFS